jgi:hypothetical protein
MRHDCRRATIYCEQVPTIVCKPSLFITTKVDVHQGDVLSLQNYMPSLSQHQVLGHRYTEVADPYRAAWGQSRIVHYLGLVAVQNS